jgi:hypothetical protein
MNLEQTIQIWEKNEKEKEDTMHVMGLRRLKPLNDKGRHQPGIYSPWTSRIPLDETVKKLWRRFG